MSAKVILTAVRGPLAGREYVFAERSLCLLGRDEDCQVRLPGQGRGVSRHHCLLDVNPPAVRVRDFGSLNGTLIKVGSSGEYKLIGRRQPGQSPEEGAQLVLPEYDLHDGDELRVLDAVFRVRVVRAACCPDCGGAVGDETAPEGGGCWASAPGARRGCGSSRGRRRTRILATRWPASTS
jgi:serine/threonine-protein kinase